MHKATILIVSSLFALGCQNAPKINRETSSRSFSNSRGKLDYQGKIDSGLYSALGNEQKKRIYVVEVKADNLKSGYELSEYFCRQEAEKFADYSQEIPLPEYKAVNIRRKNASSYVSECILNDYPR